MLTLQSGLLVLEEMKRREGWYVGKVEGEMKRIEY